MPKQRHSKSNRARSRKLRQYDPDFRVSRSQVKLLPEIEPPEDGDWSEWIAQAKKELREAHSNLR